MPRKAGAALNYAFTTLELDEVVALTAASNIPSQRVMQRLGMKHEEHDDFDHPHTLGTPLQRCVLYRIQHPWRSDNVGNDAG